jgi:hypothetical protein
MNFMSELYIFVSIWLTSTSHWIVLKLRFNFTCVFKVSELPESRRLKVILNFTRPHVVTFTRDKSVPLLHLPLPQLVLQASSCFNWRVSSQHSLELHILPKTENLCFKLLDFWTGQWPTETWACAFQKLITNDFRLSSYILNLPLATKHENSHAFIVSRVTERICRYQNILVF